MMYAMSQVQAERFEGLFEEVLEKITPLFENCRYPRETALALLAMLDGLSLYSIYFYLGDLEKYREIALSFVECSEVRL